MNKYEKLVELIINEDEEKAQELFHEIVVEKSREIYNNLVSENDATDDFVSDIESDEEGTDMNMDDEDMDNEDMGDEDMNDEDMDDEDMGDEDMGDEDLEDRVVDLEAALDELKAEFDAMMSDENMENEGMEEDFDMFAEDEDEDEDLDEDNNVIREYTEKVATPKGEDHKATSPVAGKNDMGGTTSNMLKGGTENGRPAPKAQEMSTGNRNVPGGKANSLEKAPAPKKSE